MAGFNKRGVKTAKSAGRPAVQVTSATPTTNTFEGAPAWSRDAKSELFLLAVTHMSGEDTFYESATARQGHYLQDGGSGPVRGGFGC